MKKYKIVYEIELEEILDYGEIGSKIYEEKDFVIAESFECVENLAYEAIDIMEADFLNSWDKVSITPKITEYS